MKGYYLLAPVEPGCIGPTSGIERKVRAQCDALNQYTDCELLILPVVEYKGGLKEKIVRRLPFTAAWRKWKYNGEFDGADFVYIRQPYYDSSFVRYLRKIRKHNPKIKLILEITDEPITWKTAYLTDTIFKLKSCPAAKKAAKLCDVIVNFYDHKTIFGQPCIPTLNGYDFRRVTLPERTKTDDGIHLISVSVTAPWHGYDRLIEGLHRYYENGGTENFVYHLVGTDTINLRKLVEQYHLQDHIILYGSRFGAELDEVYTKADIGVDVLGGHRKAKPYRISSSLKSREYGAWGLPLITSSRVDYLPEDSEYQCLFPFDDSPIDMDAVARYYHRLYDQKDRNQLARDIRANAESLCDMRVTMKPVSDWLRQNAEK